MVMTVRGKFKINKVCYSRDIFLPHTTFTAIYRPPITNTDNSDNKRILALKQLISKG
jgi:hypothetical protein